MKPKRKKKETIAQRVELLEARVMDLQDAVIDLEERGMGEAFAEEVLRAYDEAGRFKSPAQELENEEGTPRFVTSFPIRKPSRLSRYWAATKRFFGFGART